MVNLRTVNLGGKDDWTGTGFVVRDSAPAGGHLRMLTSGHLAGHVLGGHPGAALQVRSSDGRLLGLATVTLVSDPAAAPRAEPEAADAAVLAMSRFVGDGGRRYDSIPGLALAPRSPAGLRSGAVSFPGGVDHGDSGEAVVDLAMRVRGIVQSKFVLLGHGERDGSGVATIKVDAGDVDASRPGAPASRKVSLPLYDGAVAIGIPDDLLERLGRAGADVLAARGDPDPRPFEALLAGYPDDACIVHRGTFSAGTTALEGAAATFGELVRGPPL